MLSIEIFKNCCEPQKIVHFETYRKGSKPQNGCQGHLYTLSKLTIHKINGKSTISAIYFLNSASSV